MAPLLEEQDEQEEEMLPPDPPSPPAKPAAPKNKRRRTSLFARMMSTKAKPSQLAHEDEEQKDGARTTIDDDETPTLPQEKAPEPAKKQTIQPSATPYHHSKRTSKKRSSVSLKKMLRRFLPYTPALAQRNSTNYTPMDVKAALKEAPKSQWTVRKYRYNGRFDCRKMGQWEEVKGKRIDKGIKKFQSNPNKYMAITFQHNMRFAHDTKKCAYTLIHREGSASITPLDINEKGHMSMWVQRYQQLEAMPNDELPLQNRDAYTWDITFDGERLHGPGNPPLLPGRGMGVGDAPNLKIIGDVDPSDILQGDVGNCWLLSAVSALAEFDGAIKRLFRKTPDLDYMPDDAPNQYTVTLYDVTTWKEVDIVVDESLSCHPYRKAELLGSQITDDGELWVCYLEKAFIAHCGGSWESLEGGHCTHAWSIMTGCQEQYFIRKNYRNGLYHCSAKYDMYTQQWKQLYNQPRHEDTAGLEPVPWPSVGGGGAIGKEITKEELFLKMYAWDCNDYIVGASSKGTLEENIAAGLVRNHAYSVIDCLHNVVGTGIDLFKVRNPWGHGEIDDGMFGDTGPGWDQYPQIKAELNPVVADDGIFYMTKDEFFEFFDHIFLSACSMTEFKED